ncbi:hypothetical protein GCM10010508_17560 [Streptomyces naganishii JCM 4654]|uniref:Uncharacterized protein n=1 Tax=Streptomyces naganishii JCM 4654 TaxID=1306179 RepID=A0A919CUD3_9ACTN|nr:hypothetical protein GCM10010508_17560 [Streptomyces naganishii JCM 4654]
MTTVCLRESERFSPPRPVRPPVVVLSRVAMVLLATPCRADPLTLPATLSRGPRRVRTGTACCTTDSAAQGIGPQAADP